MKTNLKNTVTTVIAVILTLAIVFARMTNFTGYDGTNLSLLKTLEAFSCFVTLFIGLAYQIKEYQKSASIFYKLFMFFLIVNAIISFIIPVVFCFEREGVNTNYIIVAIAYLIVILCYTLLTFVKDLGEGNTKILSAVVIVINALLLINSIVKGYSVEYMYATIAGLLLALLAYTFVNAKYNDKESRGSE